MTATSKITSQGQTTVPASIRKALGVRAGDSLIWELDADQTVRVRRALALDVDYLEGLEKTLQEWSSQADEDAYREL